MPSGIYRIVCIAEGHDDSYCYVGQASDLDDRKSSHFSNLKRNKSHNPYLQNAYNKYGKDYFIFEILHVCGKDVKELTYWESYYKNLYNAKYNIREVEESNLGMRLSEETRRKISEANKGNQRWLGRKHSEETLMKISNSNRGKTRSEESKRKMSEAATGNRNSVGHAHSEETRQKMSESAKKRGITEENKQKMTEARRLARLRRKNDIDNTDNL
jgi:group I intron endonuclease